MSMRVESKAGAYQFLKNTHSVLNAELPAPTSMRDEIRAIVAASKLDQVRAHTRLPESAFLNQFIIPSIYRIVAKEIGKNKARQALLAEYHQKMREFCSGSAAHIEGHPFTKVIGASIPSIMRRWRSDKSKPLAQSWPDFALSDQFPFKIVFEGKYFESGGAEHAATELVTNIYQAFFYRSLPFVPASKGHRAWDYEYSCLLAYDASNAGTLLATWESLASGVKRGFWEGANVYVMILRGAFQ